MAKQNTIVLTGGGTAGHVMPHIAMLDTYKNLGWDVVYIGSNGIEKKLMSQLGVRFLEIPAGKLRRYISFQNFLDIFKVILGFLKSIYHLLRVKPNLVFSKGGFVSVPVSIAAWILRIPVYSHESDLTPGLANKIINPFAKKIFYCFPDTRKYLDGSRSQLVGLPIRPSLKKGDRSKAYKLCGFSEDDGKDVLLVMGGSLGAQRINDALATAMDDLLTRFNIIHITGAGKSSGINADGYKSFEFVGDELKDLFAITDVVVSRAGANSIFEFYSLQIPMVLVPLEAGSRGDQVHNSMSFEKQGLATLLREKNLNNSSLREAIDKRMSAKSEEGESFIPHNSIDLIVANFREQLDSK